MKVGPRIIILVLVAAIVVGIRDSSTFNFEAAYQTILAANAVNWCLKLVSKSLEDLIMEKIRSWESKALNLMVKIAATMKGGMLACMRGVVAWWGGDTFPPIIDV